MVKFCSCILVHTHIHTQVRKLEEKGVHEMTQVQLCEKTLSKVIEKSSYHVKNSSTTRVRRAPADNA